MHPARPCTFSRKLLSAAVLAVSYGIVSAPAFAQIEEVIVTAQKKEESLQDAPIAVTAFDSSMLEDIGAFNPTDIGEYVPNVSIVPIMVAAPISVWKFAACPPPSHL